MKTKSSLSPFRALCYAFLDLTNGEQKEIITQLGKWAKESRNQREKFFSPYNAEEFRSLYDAAKENKKLDELWNITMAKANPQKITPNPYGRFL